MLALHRLACEQSHGTDTYYKLLVKMITIVAFLSNTMVSPICCKRSPLQWPPCRRPSDESLHRHAEHRLHLCTHFRSLRMRIRHRIRSFTSQ